MAERYVTIDGREVRTGTVADAAALCRTNDGRPLTVHDLRSRITRGGPSAPPGFLMMPDADAPGGPLVARRNDRGERLVDLDAYEEWDRQRPRKGGARPRQWVTVETLTLTPDRLRLLVAARDGTLSVAPAVHGGQRRLQRLGATLIGDEPQSRHAAADRSLLEQLGLLTPPSGEDGRTGLVSLTEAGEEFLTQKSDASG